MIKVKDLSSNELIGIIDDTLACVVSHYNIFILKIFSSQMQVLYLSPTEFHPVQNIGYTSNYIESGIVTGHMA